MITLFLADVEIAALGDLLVLPDEDFRHLLEEEAAHHTYVFYVTGSVGAGKSTVVGHFRSLVAHDEWFEQRREKMGRDPDALSKRDLATIDQWVASQFGLKNTALLEVSGGLHIIDRTPPRSFGVHETEKVAEQSPLS